MSEAHILKEIRKAIDEKVIAGASIAFLHEQDIHCYYEGVQGKLPPFDSISLTAGMLYDLASLTKVIGTTTRILQMIGEKKLSLHQSVQTILPKFPHRVITIQDLLLHRAGYASDIDHKYDMDQKELLEAVYQAPLCYEPRNKMQYSDVGYILLGEIIQTLDQMSLEDSYQIHIFQPLHMTKTSFMRKDRVERYIPTALHPKRGLLQGQVHDHKAFLLKQCGSAGLFSSLQDVCMFVQVYLQKDLRLFSKECYDLLKDEYYKRSYGWDKRYGKDIYYHTGFTGTSILFSIEKARGMVILCNRIYPDRYEQAYLDIREHINQIYIMEDMK